VTVELEWLLTDTGLEVASLTDVTIVSKIQFVTLEVRVIEFKIFFWSVLEAIGQIFPSGSSALLRSSGLASSTDCKSW
jgi:hypothetical protein